MTARILLAAGLILLGFDVARLTMTGVAVLGVVLMVVGWWLLGGFTRDFWLSDDATSARLSRIDEDLDREQPS